MRSSATFPFWSSAAWPPVRTPWNEPRKTSISWWSTNVMPRLPRNCARLASRRVTTRSFPTRGSGSTAKGMGKRSRQIELGHDIFYDFGCGFTYVFAYASHLFRPASSPVKRFQLMHHGDAFRTTSGGKRYLERVSFRFRGDGSNERQAERFVEGRRRKHERRSAFHLLSPHLRIKIQNDDVTFFWNAYSAHSTPTERPVPISRSGSRTVARRAARRA